MANKKALPKSHIPAKPQGRPKRTKIQPLTRRQELFVKELVSKDGQITMREAAINAGYPASSAHTSISAQGAWIGRQRCSVLCSSAETGVGNGPNSSHPTWPRWRVQCPLTLIRGNICLEPMPPNHQSYLLEVGLIHSLRAFRWAWVAKL